MILVRLALYGMLAGSFGLAVFGLMLVPRAQRDGVRIWLVAGAGLAFLASLAWLPLMAAQMTGGAAWPIDFATVHLLLGSTALGTAWLVRMAALIAAGVAACGRGRAFAIVAPSTGIALATLAWGGHGAMDSGAIGWLHLSADMLHLLASGVWIGALIGLVLLLFRPAARSDATHLALAHAALRGFGPIGTCVVAILIVTGIVNGWLIVGPGAVGRLPATLYGQLLLAKLALFGAMLLLAALNRFRLTPAFERAIAASDTRAALAALRRSLAMETGCAILILALVAWLGTLEPPVSV